MRWRPSTPRPSPGRPILKPDSGRPDRPGGPALAREFVLVRHASTAWTGIRYCGRHDPWLDSAGRAAASHLAQTLAPTLAADVRIVASPLRRARQTALAIRAALDAADGQRRRPRIEIDPRWIETDFGQVEGCTFDQLDARFPDIARRLLAGDSAIDWPGGETAAALAERVGAAWQALLRDPRPAVVVSHGWPLRLVAQLASDGATAREAVLPPTGVLRVRA